MNTMIDDKLMGKEAMGMISQLEETFKKFPHLPAGVVDFLVNIAPWMSLIGAVLLALLIPLFLLGGGLTALLALNPMYAVLGIVNMVLYAAMAFLLYTAHAPLKDRALKGWVLLFWVEVLSVVSTFINGVNGGNAVGSLISAFISLLIGFYFAFETKPRYK